MPPKRRTRIWNNMRRCQNVKDVSVEESKEDQRELIVYDEDINYEEPQSGLDLRVNNQKESEGAHDLRETLNIRHQRDNANRESISDAYNEYEGRSITRHIQNLEEKLNDNKIFALKALEIIQDIDSLKKSVVYGTHGHKQDNIQDYITPQRCDGGSRNEPYSPEAIQLNRSDEHENDKTFNNSYNNTLVHDKSPYRTRSKSPCLVGKPRHRSRSGSKHTKRRNGSQNNTDLPRQRPSGNYKYDRERTCFLPFSQSQSSVSTSMDRDCAVTCESLRTSTYEQRSRSSNRSHHIYKPRSKNPRMYHHAVKSKISHPSTTVSRSRSPTRHHAATCKPRSRSPSRHRDRITEYPQQKCKVKIEYSDASETNRSHHSKNRSGTSDSFKSSTETSPVHLSRSKSPGRRNRSRKFSGRTTDHHPNKRLRKNNSEVAISHCLGLSDITRINRLIDPGHIVQELIEGDLFTQMLNKSDLCFESMEMTLGVLAKSVKSVISTESFTLLMKMVLESIFINKHLPTFLIDDNIKEQSIVDALQVFQSMIKLLPDFCKKISIPLQTMKNIKSLSEKTATILDDIDGQYNNTQHIACKNMLHYKNVSMIPDLKDMKKEDQRLQKIKIHGIYKDSEQLLDIHFRLLREDFIRPLRKGIEEYQERVSSNASLKNINNVKIYQGVEFIGRKCTFNGIAFTVKFDTTGFKNMRWQSSKRLMNGSLLCLSKDNFCSCIFAVVYSRSPDQLRKGFVDVNFVDNTENSTDLLTGNFTMVESEAYFESYKHVLKQLQNMSEIPFSKYIVQQNTNIEAPKYLCENSRTRYDLSTIMLPSHDSTVLQNENNYLDTTNEIDADVKEKEMLHESRKRHNGKVIPLLDNTWPDISDLGLDDSQFRALQKGITEELCLIQGPPGTGKTFIGLKIIQVFLSNNEIIHGSQIDVKPILVVCYTNHALDQFLEGISTLDMGNGRIVRVGGGCKNEKVSRFTLPKLRRGYTTYPPKLKTSGHLVVQEKHSIKNKLTRVYAEIELLKNGVVHEKVLKNVMGKHYHDIVDYCHDKSFVNSVIFSSISPLCNKHLNDYALLEWLFRDDPKLRTLSNPPNNKKIANKTSYVTNLDDDGEVDAETLQRCLEIYEDDLDNRNEICIDTCNNCLALSFPGDTIPLPNWLENYKEIVTNMETMTNDQYKSVKNVWTLTTKERWMMYMYWVKVHKELLNREMKNLEEQYSRICTRDREILEEKDKLILRNASVVGMTTTGVAKFQHILQEIGPKIIIIEEAAEILEAQILTTLTTGCEHLIMIGDHKQLRPKTASHDIGKKYNLQISLFERLVSNGIPYVTLKEQHRMRPDISNFMRHIYLDLEDHPSVSQYENIRGISGNVGFIGHGSLEDQESDLMSKSNAHEAMFISEMTNYLHLQEYEYKRITILTPYMGQVLKLRRCLPKDKYPDLRITAIDNFQGEENDIIIFSLVRSNNNCEIGFLKEENRICVALSRAKMGFYIIGNFKMFESVSRLWRKIITTAYKNKFYKQGLEVCCQNHLEKRKLLVNAPDFSKHVPCGGCNEPCKFRLKCGHSCKSKCHPSDKNHNVYVCKEICNQIVCNQNHTCAKRCHFNEPCGQCDELVEKILPECKHTQRVKCSTNESEVICQCKCEKKLDCGHHCNRKCGESHTKCCKFKVTKVLSCGHKMEVECNTQIQDVICNEKCDAILRCGHPCSGSCGTCLQGRIHVPCHSVCDRTLVCGHRCDSVCSVPCPPCDKPCENTCTHSICLSYCGCPCPPCREPCVRWCQHKICRKECSEICDIKRCDVPCYKKLKCGHRCIGLCGEKCPRLCKICNKSEVEEIFFGTEDEEDAKFLELPECGHILEVSGLDEWIDSGDVGNESEVSVKPKTCPKCKTPLKKSRRYHSAINKVMSDVNDVKIKLWGTKKEIDDLENEVDKVCYTLKYQERCIFTDIKHKMMAKARYLPKSYLQCLVNVAEILKKVSSLKESIVECPLDSKSQQSSLQNQLTSQVDALYRWSTNYRENLNEQEIAELQLECQRMVLLKSCCKVEVHRLNSSVDLDETFLTSYMELLENLISGYPFLEVDIENGQNTLQTVNSKIGGLGISDEERIQIVHAVGLKQGHWYKCPNGHIYCIGECGGAMEMSKCPECKEHIGGKQHALTTGNHHAPEMDDSNYAAWSDQANMANYNFDDI